MSALKLLVVAAFLVGGLYGVYLLLNYNPDAVAPSEAAADWPTSLSVSQGTPATASPAAPRWNSDGGGISAPVAAPAGGPGAAPPYAAPASSSGSPLLPPASDPGSGTSAAPTWPSQPPTAVDPAEASRWAQPGGFTPPADMGAPAVDPMSTGPAPAGVSPTQPAAPPANREDYVTFTQRVTSTLQANRLAEAHLMLSQRYTDPSTSPEEAQQLQTLLDQLAGTVVYSPQSHIEAPYEVLATDTLESIAQRYEVTPGLLVKINGLDPGVPPRPGDQIKVVRGPFKAVVDVGRCELTLLLADGRYAGRFPIGVGPELRQDGSLTVTDKRDLTAPIAGATPPDGSWGTRWIGLDRNLGLHGTNVPGPLGRPVEQGCISLSQRDIEDLYDILSVGSTVIIRR